jgi:hypothetical protein
MSKYVLVDHDKLLRVSLETEGMGFGGYFFALQGAEQDNLTK